MSVRLVNGSVAHMGGCEAPTFYTNSSGADSVKRKARQCIAVVDRGLSRGAVRLKPCPNNGDFPLPATKTINIPGLIRVEAGKTYPMCAAHIKMVLPAVKFS